MAIFRGEHEETFTVNVPLDEAKAHFANLDNIAKNYDGIETFEKPDDATLHIHLAPQSAMGSTFKGEHVCRYTVSEREVTWKSDPGSSMSSRGHATFHALDEHRTSITYRDEIECDIDINRFLAKALRPIVSHNIEKGVKTYLEKMRKGLRKG